VRVANYLESLEPRGDRGSTGFKDAERIKKCREVAHGVTCPRTSSGLRIGAAQPSEHRGSDTPVVDYHADPDRCEKVIAALMDEYGRYLEAEHAS